MKRFIILLGLLLVGSCSLETPEQPPADNPWDPANPNPPRAPDNIQGEVLTERSVAVTWRDRSGNEDGFIVEGRVVGADDTLWLQAGAAAAAADSIILIGQPPASFLSFRVVAFNEAGRSPSEALTLNTSQIVPMAPESLRVTATDGISLLIQWKDCSANETLFELYTSTDEERFTRYWSYPPNSESIEVAGFPPSERTYFKVRAFNSFGVSSFTPVQSACPAEVPLLPPRNLHIFPTEEDQIYLEWEDANRATGQFRVYESPDDTSHFSPVATLPGGTCFLWLSDREENSDYFYRLQAVNAYGQSSFSETIHGYTGAITPRPPDAHSIGFFGEEGVELKWIDNSGIETGFLIQESIGDSLHFGNDDPVRSNVTRRVYTRKSLHVDHFYRIRALGIHGASKWVSFNPIVPGARAPYPPQIFQAEEVLDTGKVSLSWRDNSDIEEEFVLQRKTEPTGAWIELAQLPPNAAGYLDSSCRASTPYTYQLCARNRYGASEWDTSNTVLTPGPPPRPVSFAASGTDVSAIRLNWLNPDAPGGIGQIEVTGYMVQDSLEGRGFWRTLDTTETANYSHIDCETYIRHYYRVKAFNSYGESAWSNVAFASPRATVAFICANNGGIMAVDVTDPANPTPIRTITPGGFALRAVVDGEYLFAALGHAGVTAVKISSPVQMAAVAAYDTEGRAYGLAVRDNVLYCADGDSGIVILNFVNRNDLNYRSRLRTLPGSARNVLLFGDHLYTAAESCGLLSVNVRTPGSPFIDRESLGNGSTEAVSLRGPSSPQYLLLAEFTHLRILRESTLALQGEIALAGSIFDVTCDDGRYAYVSAFENGIYVINVANPASPSALGSRIGTPDDVWSLAVLGDRLYAAADGAGVLIYNVALPQTPQLIGTIQTPGPARGVTIVEYR